MTDYQTNAQEIGGAFFLDAPKMADLCVDIADEMHDDPRFEWVDDTVKPQLRSLLTIVFQRIQAKLASVEITAED